VLSAATGSALNRCRPLGIAGGVLLAIGAVAAGAFPGRDPFADVALAAAVRWEAGLGLVAAIAGMGLLVTAWWRLGRLVRETAVAPSALVATLAAWIGT
jgi:alpha-1,6-mannosyltransferase